MSLTMTSTTDQSSLASAGGGQSSQEWRLPGQHHRSHLLTTDESTGGSSFTLNPTVPISKYYQVSQRAYGQFRDSCDHLNEHNADEIYLMGNRLIKFLTSVLPQHSQYASDHPELIDQQREVKGLLVTAGQLLGAVSLEIDRLEYERYERGERRCYEKEEEDGDGGSKGYGGGGMGMDYGFGDDSDDDENDASVGSELESIAEEDENEDEDDDDEDGGNLELLVSMTYQGQTNGSNPAAENWEADFSSLPSSPPPARPTAPSTPSPRKRRPSPQKSPSSILQNSSLSGRSSRDIRKSPPPRIRNRSRRVSFSPDVKPGKHHDCTADLSTDLSTSLSADLDEDEHETFLQMTQMEFRSDGEEDIDDNDGGVSGAFPRPSPCNAPPNLNDSIDDDAVVAAATEGISSSFASTASDESSNIVTRTDRALDQLSQATQALSVQVRRFETVEVDDAPSDEEHESDAESAEDEFASAPVNDVSGSTVVDEEDDSQSEGESVDDVNSSGQLSFIHRVALENFAVDFNRSAVEEKRSHQVFHEEEDSDEDSWAQNGDGDGDDDFDTTNNSESGDHANDFGVDASLHDELRFDGTLPFPATNGQDPFPDPFPDDDEGFDFSAHRFGFDHLSDSSAKRIFTSSERAPKIPLTSKHALSKEELLPNAGLSSGTDADETVPTVPSSSANSQDYYTKSSRSSGSASAASSSSSKDESVPDRLDYLESKLQILQHSRARIIKRSPSPTIIGEDEVEV